MQPKTGFYLKKYLNEDVNIQTGGGSQGHIWPLFRLAEIYLNYAEALNEYDPENADNSRIRQSSAQPCRTTESAFRIDAGRNA